MDNYKVNVRCRISYVKSRQETRSYFDARWNDTTWAQAGELLAAELDTLEGMGANILNVQMEAY